MFGVDLRELLIYGGGGLLGLALVAAALKSLLGGRGRKKGRARIARLDEDLADYPDPPPTRDGPRLFVDGVPARLRLVVVVPTGTRHEPIDLEEIPDLLNGLIRGLGACVASDRPRLRVWPPQLSVKGFAPSFFREVPAPDGDGALSAWTRLAGLARARGRPYLLGLALLTDDDTDLGAIALEPNEWVRHLSIGR
jgi:hypothetical protein